MCLSLVTMYTYTKIVNSELYRRIFLPRNHEHGAVNIFNSPKVMVKNCTFLNNTSSSFFTRKPFQGNAGGLSIGYNTRLATRPLNSFEMVVTDCNFTYNHAIPPLHLQASINDVFLEDIFSGRGGALSVPVNITGELNCTVNNSVFVDNHAIEFGGSVYFGVGFTAPRYQTYVFGNNFFKLNSANFGAALCFASQIEPLKNFYQSTVVYNCTFVKNTGKQFGGGVYLHPSFLGLEGTYVRFERCWFYSNMAVFHGGAIEVVTGNHFGNRQNLIPVEFVHW